MSENITLSNDFLQCSEKKGVKTPPESSEDLMLATGNGEKGWESKKSPLKSLI